MPFNSLLLTEMVEEMAFFSASLISYVIILIGLFLKELQQALMNGNMSHFSEEACRMMIGKLFL
jgi:hypothetical protein